MRVHSILLLLPVLLFLCTQKVGAILQGDKPGNKDNRIKFAVGWYDGKTGQIFCTGSVITDQHVLTAAHCFMDILTMDEPVHRDAYASIASKKTDTTFKPYHVAHVYVHPTFTAYNLKHNPSIVVDLAVVKLKEHVQFFDTLTSHDSNPRYAIIASKPVFSSYSQPGSKVNVMGYGMKESVTRYDPFPAVGSGRAAATTDMMLDPRMDKDPDFVYKMAQQVHSYDTIVSKPSECKQPQEQQNLQPGEYTGFNERNYLCVAITADKGACYGDGGAPMLAEILDGTRGTGNYVIVGVFSGLRPFGECGVKNIRTKRKEEIVLSVNDDGTLFTQVTAIQQYPESNLRNYEKYVAVSEFADWIQHQTNTILPSSFDMTTLPPTPRAVNINEPKLSFTCRAQDCGKINNDASCWCDTICELAGDCCTNMAQVCAKETPNYDGGTCKLPGVCGYKSTKTSNGHGCWCDRDCLANGDCCPDFAQYCGMSEGGGEQSCVGRCGGKAVGCFCDGNCMANNDCCLDYSTCLVGETGDGGSCVGKCGKRSGACWCDPGCVEAGDCCPNYQARCGDIGSCEGKCGHSATTCWCDVMCETKGDCCSDFSHFCSAVHMKTAEIAHALGCDKNIQCPFGRTLNVACKCV